MLESFNNAESQFCVIPAYSSINRNLCYDDVQCLQTHPAELANPSFVMECHQKVSPLMWEQPSLSCIQVYLICQWTRVPPW